MLNLKEKRRSALILAAFISFVIGIVAGIICGTHGGIVLIVSIGLFVFLFIKSLR